VKERIAAIQRALGVEDDGILGNITLTALEKRLGIGTKAEGAAPAAGAVQDEPPLVSLLLSIAQAEIGVHETSQNQGPGIAKYWTATSYPDGYEDRAPYCAAFMCWVFMEAGKRLSLGFKRPQTAAAFGFETWGRDNGLTVVKSPQRVKRGDLVVYSFSHVGLAETDSDSEGSFSAIEGNTNAAGEREGGAVMRKRRKVGVVRSVVTL